VGLLTSNHQYCKLRFILPEDKIMLQKLIVTSVLWSIAWLGIFSLPVLVQASNSQSMTIYKYLDADGVLHLTNKPPKKSEDILYARSYTIEVYTPPPIPSFPQLPLPTIKPSARAAEYAPLINLVAQQMGLPAALLHAVIKVESGYNPRATSPKGAVGLMQLMPGTAQRFGVTDRTDPMENLRGGARYLSELLKLFNQDLSLALAGYNAGENAVIRYGYSIPPYRETQGYVKKVQAWYQHYQQNPLGLLD